MTSVDEKAADDVADHETSDARAPGSARPPRRTIRRVLRPVAALGSAALLAGAGYQSWLLFEHQQAQAAAGAALAAAQRFAVTLTTASPATIDQQISDVIGGSTGDFHDRYAKRSADLRAMLIANGVTTRGTVVDSAVKSADAHTATALLFVKQTFTSAALPAAPAGRPGNPPPDVTGMSITVRQVDGRWLVSDVVAAQREQ